MSRRSRPSWGKSGSDFDLIGEIRAIETIATGHGIRILDRIDQEYGKGNWQKLKGMARVRLPDGTPRGDGDPLV